LVKKVKPPISIYSAYSITVKNSIKNRLSLNYKEGGIIYIKTNFIYYLEYIAK